MSSPRKSSRSRTRINYATLLGYESDEDDFIINGSEIPKTPKRKMRNGSDDEYEVKVSPTALSSKPDKKGSPDYDPSRNKKSTRTRKLASNSTDVTPKPLTKQPLVTVSERAHFSNVESFSSQQAKHPGNLPTATEPLTPLNNAPASVCVTPSSALRIGLSRKNIRKTLHPNIRTPH
ncbi:hypothetical protein TcWFU_004810 [Taenia crassiceps]|uniref:RAD51 interacting motif domain-containing protein n=1 Tax=Taenia crassiceps TaxID=6207 RepID=A0ABR4Q5L0_9CEST